MIGRFFSLWISGMIASGERRANQYLVRRYGPNWQTQIQK